MAFTATIFPVYDDGRAGDAIETVQVGEARGASRADLGDRIGRVVRDMRAGKLDHSTEDVVHQLEVVIELT